MFLVASPFVGIRLLNPDLWQPWNGGEKFMEFAFLNATLRSPHFPPYDPYFAGGILNYYYYGLYLVGLPDQADRHLRLKVAFNLAVPRLFCADGARRIFSVAHSRSRRGCMVAGGMAATWRRTNAAAAWWLDRRRCLTVPVRRC